VGRQGVRQGCDRVVVPAAKTNNQRPPAKRNILPWPQRTASLGLSFAVERSLSHSTSSSSSTSTSTSHHLDNRPGYFDKCSNYIVHQSFNYNVRSLCTQ